MDDRLTAINKKVNTCQKKVVQEKKIIFREYKADARQTQMKIVNVQ